MKRVYDNQLISYTCKTTKKFTNQESSNDDRLIHAVKKGDVIEILHLMDNNVNLEFVDQYGKKAIHYAVEYGNMEIVSCLIYYGAKLIDLDNENISVLMYACYSSAGDKPDLIRLLYKYAPELDVNHRNSYGCTAIWYACFYGHHQQIRELIYMGANLMIQNIQNINPIQLSRGRRYISRAFELSYQIISDIFFLE